MYGICLQQGTDEELTQISERQTTYEILTGHKPDSSNLRIFVTKCRILKLESIRNSKTEPKVWDITLFACDPGNAYCAYIPTSKHVFALKDVTLVEKSCRYPNDVTFEIGNQNTESIPENPDDIDDSDDESGYAKEEKFEENGRHERLPCLSGQFNKESNAKDSTLC